MLCSRARVSRTCWRASNVGDAERRAAGALRGRASPRAVRHVFNIAEHISVLNRHFDDLIRAATVTFAAIGGFPRGLRPGERDRD